MAIKKETPLAENVSKEIVSTQQNQVKDFDIDAFLDKRKEFITKVNKIMVQGNDYHVIKDKKSLAKGGAEKIASIFGWQAEFVKDTDTLEMFGNDKGLVAYVCTLTKSLEFVGQGRGAAKNTNDPNKTIKMAQKSAFIDAVLRSSGLSDFFTQDLEDMNPNEIGKTPSNDYTPTTKQLDYLDSLAEQKGYEKEELISMGLNPKSGLSVSKWIETLKNENSVKQEVLPVIQQEETDPFKLDLELRTKIEAAKSITELGDLANEITQIMKKKVLTKEQIGDLKEVYKIRYAEVIKK